MDQSIQPGIRIEMESLVAKPLFSGCFSSAFTTHQCCRHMRLRRPSDRPLPAPALHLRALRTSCQGCNPVRLESQAGHKSAEYGRKVYTSFYLTINGGSVDIAWLNYTNCMAKGHFIEVVATTANRLNEDQNGGILQTSPYHLLRLRLTPCRESMAFSS